MKISRSLPSAIVLFGAPLAAYAQGGAPHIELYALGGGFAGGLIGALLACWFCCRKDKRPDNPVVTKRS